MIPHKYLIIFYLNSVLKDPELFENPKEFNPGRFLDSAGDLVKPKELIPFVLGRHVCLCEALAEKQLFLFSTTIIKQFDFIFADDDPQPSLEGTLGIYFLLNLTKFPWWSENQFDRV